jgi:hypothetical protein
MAQLASPYAYLLQDHLLSLARVRAEAQGIRSVVKVHQIEHDNVFHTRHSARAEWLFFGTRLRTQQPRTRKMSTPKPNRIFSLDTWAVLLALIAAVLVHFGIIKNVPW